MEDNRLMLLSGVQRSENDRPIRDGRVSFEETSSGLTKMIVKSEIEPKVDFEKLITTLDMLEFLSESDELFNGSEDAIRNLRLFINKLSQSSSFAHKAHKELQKLMK